MELKYKKKAALTEEQLKVLIVPLWNWNVGTELILNNGPMF